MVRSFVLTMGPSCGLSTTDGKGSDEENDDDADERLERIQID